MSSAENGISHEKMREFSSLNPEDGVNHYLIDGPIGASVDAKFLFAVSGVYRSTETLGVDVSLIEGDSEEELNTYLREISGLTLPVNLERLRDNLDWAKATELRMQVRGLPSILMIRGASDLSAQRVVELSIVRGLSPKTALSIIQTAAEKCLAVG